MMVTNSSTEDTGVDWDDVNVSTDINYIPDDEDYSTSTTSTVAVVSISTPDFPRSRVLQIMRSKAVEEGYDSGRFLLE